MRERCSLRACAFVFAAAAFATEPAKTYPPKGYTLVWHDDFSGTALDASKWNYRTDVKKESSQKAENVEVAGGNLVIWLRKEEHRGRKFTTGGVVSKRTFRYGYYEARVKMHGGAGWHQSVWGMAGTGETTYHGDMRTEIDAMEFDSDRPNFGHMGLILWHGPASSRSTTCTPGVYRGPLGFDATTDFHVYGFEWTPADVRYYLDGELRCVLPHPAEEHEHDPIVFWLTGLAYESSTVKVDESKLPGQMLVDQASFYQKDVWVDDGEEGYSDQGGWTTAGRNGYSQSNARRTCTPGATATWRPRVPADGDYEVAFYRLPQRVEESRAEVEVQPAGGAPKSFDFFGGAKGWEILGTYHFSKGGRGFIRMKHASGCVAADMVRLMRKQ